MFKGVTRLKAGKVFLIILIILTVIAIQDFILNGPEKVIGGYFEKLSAESRRRARLEGVDELPCKIQKEKIIESKDSVKSLAVVNPYGNIKTSASEDENIVIDFTIKVYAEKEEQAAEYLKRVAIKKKVENGKLTLAFREPKIRKEYIRAIRVDYDIKVPKGIRCEIDSGGEISLRNLSGNFDITNTSGSTTVKNLTGDLTLKSHLSEVEIIGVKGNVNVETSRRSVYLADIEGDLDIKNQNNDVLIEGVTGNISGENFNSDFELVDVEGKIKIKNEYGDTRIETVTGPVIINASGDVELEDISGYIDVIADRGDIRLQIPKEAAGFKIDAATSRGEIRTRLPLSVEKKDRGEVATGTLGNGEYNVTLLTRNGDIYIRD